MVSLADIDGMFTGSPGFRIVDRLAIAESGVDPIGLRQLNLDLMDATVPGINNVTMHIRPYTFMAWAWWKASKVAEENGEVSPAKMADLAARYEVMYAWAHSLAGSPFRGAVAIRQKFPLKGSDEPYLFEGAKWEDFKVSRTGLMAPTEYGPSIKALRFLKPEEGGVFVRSREVEGAVMTIDGLVASCLPERLIAVKAPSVAWQEVFPLAEQLPAASPSAAEKNAFRFLFHGAGAEPEAPREIKRRKATIDLLRAILPEGSYVGIPEIRRRLAARTGPEVSPEGQAEVGISAALLSILQARQLQRLAIETMMLWVERSLFTEVAKARPTEDLVAGAQAAAAQGDEIAASAATVGDYMDTVEALGAEAGWPRAAGLPDTDVIALMDRLHEMQRKDISRLPALALRAFAVVYAMTKAVRDEKLEDSSFDPIEARPDRLPMGIMARRIDAIRDKPLAVLWGDIIESWIIAQHVHWSAVRGTDGKKRLRIGLEGSGWIRVRPKASAGFQVTPDRLLTLLSLGSECGLFARSEKEEKHFGRGA